MKFKTEIGPYVKDENNTNKIMKKLLIALSPIIAFGLFKNIIMVYYYTGESLLSLLNPLYIIIVGVLTSLITEYLYIRFILKNNHKETLKALSTSYAIIPGLLLALVLPINTPIWIVFFGAFCATLIGKMLFGGFGKNIFNPALIGYLLIGAAYSSKLGSYLNIYEFDTIGGATPLANLASLDYISSYNNIVGNYGNLLNFFTGTIPGMIGEVSKVLIILAFIFLTITKTIKWRIPVFYVSTVFIITFLIGYTFDLGIWYPLFHILSGGLLFGAVFMTTDPVTSPITNIGQIFYGICLGILTVLLRFLTSYPEGVMTSILFMNLLVFLFDKIGIYFKYKIKRIYIPILISIALITSTYYIINNALNNKEENKNTNIINTEKLSNKTIYTVTSKGWNLITAEVTVENKKITDINVTNNDGETKWNDIENANYLDKLITNQNKIDTLDGISGCTYTVDGLKNIIKVVMEEVK